MFTLLTTVRGKTEAVLLVARLHDAGIPCMRGGADGPRGTPRSAREIYVDEASLPRAQEILEEDRGADFDEEELARLSEEAGQRWAHEDSPAAQSTAHAVDVAHEDSPAAQSTAHAVDVAGDVQAATPTKGHRVRHAIERLAGRKADTFRRDPFGR
jgi:hypothetical protein